MKFFQNLFGSSSQQTTAPLSPSSSASDSERINQEMYKKSAELSVRNKTLSLLQKLDAIILGSITHLDEIAQLVTSLLVKDANLDSVFIYLYDKELKALRRLAYSETSKFVQIPYVATLPLSKTDNLIVQSVNEQIQKIVMSPENITIESGDFANPDIKQALSQVKSVQVHPLIVRNDVLGALVLSIPEDDQAISEYRRDLFNRLADTIGIALDNALLYNQVQSANARLKQLDKLKDEFVSVASHELRTPMTAIKSYLWMALDGRGGPVSEKQKEYLSRAYSSVDRLIRLVNDMLNVSRIDSGRVTIQLGAAQLPVLTKEVFDEVMPRVQELGLHLVMTDVPNLPTVLADADKIKEVLFNLIGNSLKFTPRGGTITVSFLKKDNMIETTVTDNGRGIAPENIEKLFTKFTMIPESYGATTQIQGTGLGLYITKSVIELHGGRIWVQSAGLGKGAQFTFSLRIATQADLDRIAKQPKDENKPMIDIVHSEI